VEYETIRLNVTFKRKQNQAAVLCMNPNQINCQILIDIIGTQVFQRHILVNKLAVS
jgi:hypothetical protein